MLAVMVPGTRLIPAVAYIPYGLCSVFRLRKPENMSSLFVGRDPFPFFTIKTTTDRVEFQLDKST